MDERKILKKLIAGEYFEKGDYFTEKQLKSLNLFVSDFRKILDDEESKNYFRETIKCLLFSNNERTVYFATSFGRYYLDDEVICSKLRELTENPLDNSFRIKVQAIYELLVEESTDEAKKQEWYEYLINNIEKYKQLFRQVYEIYTNKNRTNYFAHLLEKLSGEHDNKKWMYFIELVVLGINKEETSKKISEYVNSEDKLVSKVARECLQRL